MAADVEAKQGGKVGRDWPGYGWEGPAGQQLRGNGAAWLGGRAGQWRWAGAAGRPWQQWWCCWKHRHQGSRSTGGWCSRVAESWGVHKGVVGALGMSQQGISCNGQGSRAALVRVTHCGTKGHCCGVAGWRVAALVAAASQEWGMEGTVVCVWGAAGWLWGMAQWGGTGTRCGDQSGSRSTGGGQGSGSSAIKCFFLDFPMMLRFSYDVDPSFCEGGTSV